MKPVVIGIVVKKGKDGLSQILTQTRKVLNPKYDPLYDDTQEAMGETKLSGENDLRTLRRGLGEELGLKEEQILKILDGVNRIFSTRPGEDQINFFQPFGEVRQIQGPQEWKGKCYLVWAESNFQPCPQDGEVSDWKWWRPETLLKELIQAPKNFMGLHYPFLCQVASHEFYSKVQHFHF